MEKNTPLYTSINVIIDIGSAAKHSSLLQQLCHTCILSHYQNKFLRLFQWRQQLLPPIYKAWTIWLFTWLLKSSAARKNPLYSRASTLPTTVMTHTRVHAHTHTHTLFTSIELWQYCFFCLTHTQSQSWCFFFIGHKIQSRLWMFKCLHWQRGRREGGGVGMGGLTRKTKRQTGKKDKWRVVASGIITLFP